jgi:hypothetical protein
MFAVDTCFWLLICKKIKIYQYGHSNLNEYIFGAKSYNFIEAFKTKLKLLQKQATAKSVTKRNAAIKSREEESKQLKTSQGIEHYFYFL